MNLEDKRLAKIESEKQNAINNNNSVYQNLNNQAQNLYNQQQQYAADYQKTQDEVLDKQLANQTAKIEQQKQKATENRDTEAVKARNDYQAYINPYGVNAESLASRGLLNSGLSETSQLGGYNTYQNRVASANKALQDAITAYDNDINDAQLNNDVSKAQNALTKLEMQLKYAQSYYDTTSELAQKSLSNQQALRSQYANQYQAMLGQILDENQYKESVRQYNKDLAEKQRQYNQNMAYQKARDKVADAQWQKEYELSKKSVAVSRKSSGGSRSSGGSGGGSGKGGKAPIGDNNQTSKKVHKDAKYGTFSNGYQPDNVGGKKLSKSGKKVSDVFSDASLQSNGKNSSFGKQNIWTDGKNYYVWVGDDYVKVSDAVSASKSWGKKVGWGATKTVAAAYVGKAETPKKTPTESYTVKNGKVIKNTSSSSSSSKKTSKAKTAGGLLKNMVNRVFGTRF